ncbi:MAG: hypothetical protein HQ562_05870 [Candidatus Marinimicrobia bacterium]|nr:hypothetical protein [Candidatus Neomarinimicrobiota bacterium]
MKKKTIIIVVTLVMAVTLIICLAGCENSTVVGNTTAKPVFGIPADQITWVSWKPDVIDLLMNANSLNKIGETGQMITITAGGIVGGNITFGNTVYVPPGAVPANTYIEVGVVCVDGKEQCGSGIDFLPNMQFLTDVKITLSWESVDVDSLNADDFEVFYSDDDGLSWFEIDDLEIDYDAMTIAVWQDHFTRYAWGLSISANL